MLNAEMNKDHLYDDYEEKEVSLVEQMKEVKTLLKKAKIKRVGVIMRLLPLAHLPPVLHVLTSPY